MIWLPGVLSQGGEKFTWGRYSVVRKEVISENETVVHGGGVSVYWSNSYTVTDGELYLGTTHASSVSILKANMFYVTTSEDGAEDGAEAVIYEVVSVTQVDSAYQVVRKVHRMQEVIGTYIDTVEATNADTYPENGAQGGYWYIRYSDTPITWERYAFTESMVQGESVTQTATSSTYFYCATSYSRSGKTFTATGTRTRASSLAVGNYLIQNNGSFVRSTNMSGDTLFEITAKTTSGYSNVSLTFATYTIGDVKGSYIDTVTSYNPYEYPDDGAQDGYWYVLVESGSGSGSGSGSDPSVNYVGYIQTSGSQYIKSGFAPNQDTRVVCEVEFAPTSSSSQYIFGSRTSASADQFGVRGTSSGYQMKYSSADGSTTSGTTSGRFVMDCNKNTFTLAGTTFTGTYANFTCPGEMYVFALYNNGVAYGFATAKLYYMKIYDNGVLVRYYKPCLDPDGVACLYDEVNAEYVYNAGSGTFAYGMAA